MSQCCTIRLKSYNITKAIEAADHMSSLRRRLMMPDFDIIYQFLNRTNYQCDFTICMCLNKCTFLHSQWNMFIGNQICQAETNNMQHRCRLSVHNTISLSSLCTLIWRHWSYKMPVGYILSSVWVRLSIFSQLSTIQYMGMCVFSLPISFVMIEGIYIWSYYHHQIGSMKYSPLSRVRSCIVCLPIF